MAAARLLESGFVRTLMRDYRDMGGFAQKASDRFTIGVPDLFIHLEPHGSFWIEAKVLTLAKHHIRGYPIRLTPMQRATLDTMQKAGVQCGWVLLVRATSNRVDQLYASSDHQTAFTMPNQLVTEGVGFRYGTVALLNKLFITRRTK